MPLNFFHQIVNRKKGANAYNNFLLFIFCFCELQTLQTLRSNSNKNQKIQCIYKVQSHNQKNLVYALTVSGVRVKYCVKMNSLASVLAFALAIVVVNVPFLSAQDVEIPDGLQFLQQTNEVL